MCVLEVYFFLICQDVKIKPYINEMVDREIQSPLPLMGRMAFEIKCVEVRFGLHLVS